MSERRTYFQVPIMNIVEFICPDCGHVQSKETPMPPKITFQLLPDPVPCSRCKETYPKSWVTANQFLTVRELSQA